MDVQRSTWILFRSAVKSLVICASLILQNPYVFHRADLVQYEQMAVKALMLQ